MDDPAAAAAEQFFAAAPGDGSEASAELLTFEQASTRVLATLNDQLPLGLWAITRRDDDQQVFVRTHHQHHQHHQPGHLDDHPQHQRDPRLIYGQPTGAVVSWQGSMCQRMLTGAPRATGDAASVAAYAPTEAVQNWPVRTYVAAPIAAPEGGLFGTLCGYGAHTSAPDLLEQISPVVDLLAGLLGQVLLAEQLRTQAAAREARLHHLATTDHLTGLATRAVLHDRLSHALDLHRSASRPLTIVMIDVDDFKVVNDTYGHGAGDALLVDMARRWSAGVRPGNTLARIGGDEFAVLVETGSSLQEVIAAVQHGQASPMRVPGTSMQVTTSVGVAHLGAGEPTPTAAQLLERADRALYSTKAAGKAGVSIAGTGTAETGTAETGTAGMGAAEMGVSGDGGGAPATTGSPRALSGGHDAAAGASSPRPRTASRESARGASRDVLRDVPRDRSRDGSQDGSRADPAQATDDTSSDLWRGPAAAAAPRGPLRWRDNPLLSWR